MAITTWNQTTGIKATRLVSTKGMSNDEWLEWRKKGVGGSDVAGILGLSKWSSPMSLYIDKTTDVAEKVDERTAELFDWGHRLEKVVAEKFADEHPEFKVSNVNALLQGSEPWELANIDRLIAVKGSGNGVLEVKTTSEWNKDQWSGDDVPQQYITQLQWYLGICGLDWGYFVVLIGGNKYVEKRVEFDPELFEIMRERVASFWNDNVVAGVPPKVQFESDADFLPSLFPAEKSVDKNVDLSDLEFVLNQLDETRSDIKKLESSEKLLAGQIQERLGENQRGTGCGFVVDWKPVGGRTTFDSKSFEKDDPKTFAKYSKTGKPSRRFTVKKEK